MSIFIQEVLGLLNRNQKKVTLDKAKDWFEFGKLYQSSSLNNKSGYQIFCAMREDLYHENFELLDTNDSKSITWLCDV